MSVWGNDARLEAGRLERAPEMAERCPSSRLYAGAEQRCTKSKGHDGDHEKGVIAWKDDPRAPIQRWGALSRNSREARGSALDDIRTGKWQVSNQSLPDREECEALLDTITDALGCIEVGRGDHEYHEAKKALARLGEILCGRSKKNERPGGRS